MILRWTIFHLLTLGTFIYASPSRGQDSDTIDPERTIGESSTRAASQTSFRHVSIFAENPKAPSLYDHDTDVGSQTYLRQASQLGFGQHIAVEANAYGLLTTNSNKGSIMGLFFQATDEDYRSSQLERHWHNSKSADGYLTIDRFNVELTANRFSLRAGRQAVNFATTFFFTPNDFFAPFRAQAFYRQYKPGVDALRSDITLGEQSTFTLLAVAGYRSAAAFGHMGTASDDNDFSMSHSAAVGRYTLPLAGFEWSVLGGRVERSSMLGFSLQGELWETIGIRGEGHYKKHVSYDQEAGAYALGMEWRPFNDYLLQFEQFYNGAGYASATEYDRLFTDPAPPRYYFGQHYSALGIGMDVSPLTDARLIALTNWTDGSAIFAALLKHNLSDESDIALNFSIPSGRKPKDSEIRSEYGSFPRLVTIETTLFW